MEEERLKRTDEDTACILLEFIEANEQASDAKAHTKTRSRTKSVEKARALLIDGARHSKQQSEALVLEETEIEEGFVVYNTKSTQTSCHNSHLSTTRTTTTCGVPATCLQRPATLALQPAQDPEDPPLFSPCQSYPPGPASTPVARTMPKHTVSSPVLTQSCSPQIVPGCMDDTAAASVACAEPDEMMQFRIRRIADRLKYIGDNIDKSEKVQRIEEEVYSLMSIFSSRGSNGGGLWQSVTRVFSSIYKLLSLLKSQFGDSSPPADNETWQLFLKTMGLLRDDIVPWISSSGGWGAFLRSTEPCDVPIIGSPLLSRSLPTAHSTPARVGNPQCSRFFQPDYQHSPGSTRSLRICRSHTLPNKYDTHPRKLWRLSESGSLVDEDGNDDFKESMERERESDLEGSVISLDNARKIVESGDFDERDDLVFTMQTDESYHHSVSSPVIVASPHRSEPELCDSGVVSSMETLSISSTPPRDVSFALGSSPLLSGNNDSAVDISTPQAKEKKRPRSGCSFSKPNEGDVQPFDRARSRSVPMSRRPKNAGGERAYGRLKKSSQRSSVVVSSAPPCETSYSSGSVSLRLSEAVLYEAVCSLLR